MRLSHIKCQNIKGFEGDFEHDFGQVNLVMGKNATNKTSCLSLITGLFGSANPRMLRTGSESGHIEAILEDGDETWTFRREFVPGSVKPPTAKSSKSGRIGAPATWLKQILDAVSLDVIKEAMNASEERQTQILLEVMPLELPAGALKEAVKACPEFQQEAAESQAKLPALDAIAHLSQENKGKIYLCRRDVNRDVKKARSQARTYRDALPPQADGTDWKAKAEEASRKLQGIAGEEAREQVAAERQYSTAKSALESRIRGLEDGIDEEINEEIRKLEQRRKERKEDLSRLKGLEGEKLSDHHARTLKQITESIRPRRDQLTMEHAQAQERAGRQNADARTKAAAESAEREVSDLEAKSEALTSALKALEDVREALLENLPIKGLRFVDGISHLNGVPLSEVNTQVRGMFWLKVAIMRAGDLALVVADGCECFDPENFEALVKSAQKFPDIQFFFGRVDGDPFRIETL